MIFASNYVIEICPRFPSLPCHNLKVMSKCDGRLCFFLESSSLFRGFLFVFIVGKGLARGVPIYNSVVAPHDDPSIPLPRAYNLVIPINLFIYLTSHCTTISGSKCKGTLLSITFRVFENLYRCQCDESTWSLLPLATQY